MKRSINSLVGYTIKGTDGEIGKVEEFYFDDRTSTIRYIVVKTGGWFSEKKVFQPDWAGCSFGVTGLGDTCAKGSVSTSEAPRDWFVSIGINTIDRAVLQIKFTRSLPLIGPTHATHSLLAEPRVNSPKQWACRTSKGTAKKRVG